MAVHINSVISTTIDTFDHDLYVAITDKEEYLYNISVLGEVFYKPFVQDLNSAILSWMATSFTDVKDLIQAMYSGKAITNIFGGVPVTPDSRTLLTMDGWRDTIKAAAIDIWDDGVVGVPPAPDTATTLEAHTLLITNSATGDQGRITAAKTSAQGVAADASFSNLFEDIPLVNPPITKQALGELIFTTLHYAEVARYLNVGSIPVPTYIA